MTFLTDENRREMLANGAARARGEDVDPYPVLKLYTPDAGASWVLISLNADGDMAYGLIDTGIGFPELGLVSLSMLASIKGPEGCRWRASRTTGAQDPCRATWPTRNATE